MQTERAIEISVVILGIGSDVDAQFFNQATRFLAVGSGALDRIRSAEAETEGVADAELVALGVSAKVVVVIENENAGVRASRLAIEVSGRKAADAAPYDDEIVGFAGVLRGAGCVPESAVAQGVRGVGRAGMAAAQSGERGRIVCVGLLGDAVASGEQLPRHHGSSGSYGHAVQKVTARVVAFHSQFAVVHRGFGLRLLCFGFWGLAIGCQF